MNRYGLHMMQGDLAGDGREPSVNPNYLVANEDSGGSDSMSWLESTLGAFVVMVGGTMVLGLLLMCCLWVLARRHQAKRAAAREGGAEGSLEVTLKVPIFGCWCWWLLFVDSVDVGGDLAQCFQF